MNKHEHEWKLSFTGSTNGKIVSKHYCCVRMDGEKICKTWKIALTKDAPPGWHDKKDGEIIETEQ
jgi:hypothetical protein